ncbi:MAG: ABC transporter permease [Candidatus Aenigmarchaeota archaeon]|nr:ABC transporter permease [Candidatus Aenigmarchaeota archaeon]
MIGDIYAVWLREMIRFVRAKSRVISSLAMPFFWLVFIGIGIGSSFSLPGTSYITFLAPGILGMTLLFSSIFAGVSVIWDRQFGFLKELLVAPISRTSIVLGKVFGGATVSMITAMIMLVVMVFVGLISFSVMILVSIVFMALISMTFVSLGVVMASRMKGMEGFQMIMSFLIMPIFFLSGALFPLENTPGWMQVASYLDPLTYGVDGLRGALIGHSIFPITLDLTALALITISMIIIGKYMFDKAN